MPGCAEQGEGGERTDHQVPLGHQREPRDALGRGLVDGLEQAASLAPVIHPPAAGAGDVAHDALAVEASTPGDLSRPVVLLGPLALEQGLRLAIVALLAKEASYRP